MGRHPVVPTANEQANLAGSFHLSGQPSGFSTPLSGTPSLTDEVAFMSGVDGSFTANKDGDTFTGGKGADSYTAGAGADTFMFSAAAESTGAGFDTITKFDAAKDQFELWFAVTKIDTP